MGRMIRTVLQALRKSRPAEAEAVVAPPPAPFWAPTAPPAGPAGKSVYWPEIFEAKSLESAKEIALTPEENMTPEDRWLIETDFMLEHITNRLRIDERNRVIDFGCGAGRMSRALIETFGCSVVGIDISQGMREQAVKYVDSPRFTVVAPEQFDTMVADGFSADFGLACWSIQHAMYPDLQVARIANALVLEAPFLLVNSLLRLIPTNHGWHDDGENVEELMAERFTLLERTGFPLGVAAQDVINTSAITWWQRRI